ncbi:MAG: DUF6327 family protein [Flavobacterium sp.]|uniref:DUF6327 family protein n=1 Tax=Flavobacterium sp. TaxID=239 RepID=UPI003BE9935C
MQTNKYSSFAEIELDLQILKIEREIHYQKIVLSIDKTKESILPFRKVNKILESVSNFSSGMYGTILKTLIPIAINWYIKRKRGD